MSLGYSKSWLRFLENIEAAKSEIGFMDNEECFYRGHSHTNFHLLPGLYRGFNIAGKKIPSALWNKESDLFYEFRAKAKELHNQNLANWDILFFMQHHGIKTRLLDWSESLGVNYYEGYEEEGDSYSDLILYNNSADVFPWDEPIGLYPVRRSDRLTTQSGYFTIHGNDSRPIDKIVPDKKKICKKIEIPLDTINSAFSFLEHAGINQFTLFPDMDGLAEYLNEKYFK